jgi:surfactin synthase thioesterase subunit
VRLVCLPHSGGSASYYFPLSAALSPAVEVLAAQYPGRQDRLREQRIEDLHELADRVAGAVAELPAEPLAFFGHSLGAALAFEVVRRLERAGTAAPAMLFASGRRAPSRLRVPAVPVHRRDDDGVIAELVRLGGTPGEVLTNSALRALILPAVRSDYRAIETYRPAPGATIACPVTVLTGDADPATTLGEARAWRGHTTGAFDLRVLAGGHFYLEQHQDEIVRLVAGALRRVRESG